MPLDGGCGGGAGAWVRRWWRALVAELVATALLVALGVASILPVGGREPPLTHPALAFGFVVLANVEAFGPASGAHMNPAVTLTALLQGRLGAAPAAAYVATQLAGATLGFGLLRATLPAAAAAGAGCTAPQVGAGAAVLLEALVTGTLALVCCALWHAHDAARPDRGVSLKFGLVVAGLVYVAGAATGASLNPARSFGPALVQNFWTDHWVYWVGPCCGAAAAALLHRLVLAGPAPAATREPREPCAPEALPLNDKP